MKPNILFILADDLGYGDLSCYGRRDYQTPHLDRLASQGLQFLHGYANSAVCSATRTALITGRYQYRLPIGLEEPKTARQKLSLPDLPTMPAQLRKAGYETTLVGKWHLGEFPEAGPLQRGYDHFFGIHGGSADYFRHTASLGPETPPGDGLYLDNEPVKRPGYMTDLLADHAASIVAKDAGKPFFLSLHFTAPHWPWEGPGDENVSKALKDLHHDNGGNLEVYAEMVRSMDSGIGRVLSALEKSGKAENTIVVFTSDNGGERFGDMFPLIGMKTELLEGGIRVPLMWRWPARVKPGKTDQVMTSMDFMPSFLAAAGGVHDPALPPDGENLLPVITGEAPVHPRKLFWRYHAHDQKAVRDGVWKYLKIAEREFLFDVVTDQRERANLKDVHPAIFQRLKDEHAAWDRDMLPYSAKNFSDNVKGQVADRY